MESYALKGGNNPSRFTPEGWYTVTPRIVAHDPERLVGFLKQVFGGPETIGQTCRR